MGLIIQVQTVGDQLVEIDLGRTFASPVTIPVAVASAIVGAALMPRSLAWASISPLLTIAPLILPRPVAAPRSSTGTAARLTLTAPLRGLGCRSLSFRG
jgi:hypothetical protein